MGISGGGMRRPHQPTFAELFTPKLITVLREGYNLAAFARSMCSPV